MEIEITFIIEVYKHVLRIRFFVDIQLNSARVKIKTKDRVKCGFTLVYCYLVRKTICYRKVFAHPNSTERKNHKI